MTSDQFPNQLPSEFPSEQESPDLDSFEAAATVEAPEPVEAAEPAEPVEAADEILVVAVEGDAESDLTSLDEAALQELADQNSQEMAATVTAIQQELAGMAKTGISEVDAALDKLAALDPQDLAGSSETLAQVLATLESVMSQTPQE